MKSRFILTLCLLAIFSFSVSAQTKQDKMRISCDEIGYPMVLKGDVAKISMMGYEWGYEAEFDGDGCVVNLESYDGMYSASCIYYYDSNGLLEYRTSCDYEDGELAGGAKKVYLFDEKYNLVRTNVYVDGNIVSYTKYTYDVRGNRIKSESHSYENGSTVITQYTYDDKCNLVKTVSGDVVSTYSYDANNRLVKQTWQDSIAKYVCRYNYDTKGNIIGEMVYENDELSYQTIYEITYRN